MFQLNKGQEVVVNEAIKWFKYSSEQVFQYSGNAGTGKSVVLNEIIRRLGLKDYEVAPMSYVGAATVVMRNKGLHNAKTIHSWLYAPEEEPMVDKYGNIIMNEYLNRPKFRTVFVPKPLPDSIKLIVVDEAGMVPEEIRKEIDSRKIKVLACGDLDQLPPIGGNSGYLTKGKVYILDEIMRQAENSGIVYLSIRAKLGLPIHYGVYNEVIVIDQDSLTNDYLARADMVLCAKNNTRNKYNNIIRKDIFNRHGMLPTFGDKLVCRKNNWKLQCNGINLVNGLIGTVVNCPDISTFNGDSFSIDFRPYAFNSIFENVKVDYQYFSTPCGNNAYLLENKYNHDNKFEYAYCITTHISQGSQYPNGIYIEEFLDRNINKNLNYTGITSFSNSLIYVKPKPKFWSIK